MKEARPLDDCFPRFIEAIELWCMGPFEQWLGHSESLVVCVWVACSERESFCSH